MRLLVSSDMVPNPALYGAAGAQEGSDRAGQNEREKSMTLSSDFNRLYASLVDKIDEQNGLRSSTDVASMWAVRGEIDDLRYRLALLRAVEVA